MTARRIDLHTHSTASDGTTDPADLVRAASDAGLDVVALTDHDTTGGWKAAVEALPPGLSLVRGAELSCVHDGVSLHLLAYLFDDREPALAEALRGLRESRVGRAERMVRMLEADGAGVSWEQVKALAGGTVGRPHVARALVAAGLVATVSDAFTPEWIGTHGRYWVPKLELEAVDALALVTAAGGACVFAHPAAVLRGRTVDDDAVARLAEAGLAGVEVDHVDHSADARRHLRALAVDLDLLTFGSSDFHGANKSVELGRHLSSEQALQGLVDRASGAEVVAA